MRATAADERYGHQQRCQGNSSHDEAQNGNRDAPIYETRTLDSLRNDLRKNQKLEKHHLRCTEEKNQGDTLKEAISGGKSIRQWGRKNEASVLRLLIHSPTEPPELNDADAYVESEDTEDGDHCNRHDDLLVW